MFSQFTIDINGDISDKKFEELFNYFKSLGISSTIRDNRSTTKSCKCKADKSSLTNLIERMKRKKLYINSVKNEILDDFKYYKSLFEGNGDIKLPDSLALGEAIEHTVFRIDHLRDVCEERDVLQKKIDDFLNKTNEVNSSSRCCK